MVDWPPANKHGLRKRAIAERQAAALRLCVSRSGALPLRLSLQDCSCYEIVDPSPVIALIGSLLPRLQSIRATSVAPFEQFLASHPVDSFPLLEAIDLDWDSDEDVGLPQHPSYLLAPNLRDVQIQGFNTCPIDLPLRWKRLTRLALPGKTRVVFLDKLAELLKSCHQLQEGLFYVSGEEIRFGECGAAFGGDPWTTPTSNSIVLPNLRSLDITHQDCIGNLLRQLYTPKLSNLSLKGDHTDAYVQSHIGSLPMFMDRNEQCLPLIESLVLRAGIYHPPVLVASLERLPSLRTLILVDRNGSSSYAPSTPKEVRQEFDEAMLTRMTPQLPPPGEPFAGSNSSGSRASLPLPPPHCLCPLLERFEFREGDNYETNRHLTLKTVVQFVAGKWEAAQRYPGQFSALKHITVPTRKLPEESVKKALKPWRDKGLVVEIAHPGLVLKPEGQYEGAWEGPLPDVTSW